MPRPHLPPLALLLFAVAALAGCATAPMGPQAGAEHVTVGGELRRWHTVVLDVAGPATDELADPNPFRDYRLDVTFAQAGRSFTVPGFYAADGEAHETSAIGGSVWRVRFTPDAEGEGDWTYRVSFVTGPDAAVDASAPTQPASAADGASGSFTVGPTDAELPDLRARGRLQYVGEPYLRFAGSGEYFVKVGVDAPENLLAYEDFDATPDVGGRRKAWSPHARDYDAERGAAYTWQGGRGSELLGAVDYLASEGLNALSFLTFNVDGDDRNVVPQLLAVPEAEYEAYAKTKQNVEAYATLLHRDRYDVSKLAQWERVLSYAERRGLFLHVKTHEVETDHLMDGGAFGPEGKLYYRELIARFGHHLALNWNIGEENDRPLEHVRAVTRYVDSLDAYDHHRVLHTYPGQSGRYADLIGAQSALTGASLQLSDSLYRDVHPRVVRWRRAADSTGRPWAIAVDEPGQAKWALPTDSINPGHDAERGNALWGALLGGAYGVEWYFGYGFPHSDLSAEDFRSRDLFWDQNRHARTFFERHLPFWRMRPADELLAGEPEELAGAFCLAQVDSVYAVYLPRADAAPSLELGGSPETRFRVSWYDPRRGGELQDGSVAEVQGGGIARLGTPPRDEEADWVALVRRVD